jgi:hypothetical protein
MLFVGFPLSKLRRLPGAINAPNAHAERRKRPTGPFEPPAKRREMFGAAGPANLLIAVGEKLDKLATAGQGNDPLAGIFGKSFFSFRHKCGDAQRNFNCHHS